MSVTATCPACQREFRAKSDLVGRRVRCPGCSTRFEVRAADATNDLASLAVGAALPGDDAIQRSRRSTARASAQTGLREAAVRTVPAPREWTAFDRLLFRTGVGCVLFGVAAVLLPAFGLQFRKLERLGAAAPTAGWGLVGVGAFLCIYVSVLKGRLFRAALVLSSVAVVLVGGLVTAAFVIGSQEARRSRPATLSPPPAASQRPGQPRFTPPSVEPPRPAPPTVTGPGTPPTYESLCAKFGASRVARLTFTNVRGVDLAPLIRARLTELIPTTPPPTWRYSTRGDEGKLLVAPVDHFERFLHGLDLGDLSAIDAAERMATVRFTGADAETKAP